MLGGLSHLGCPFCQTASWAVLKFNQSVPIGDRIEIVDIFPTNIGGRYVGDPRLELLAKINQTYDVMQMGFPILCLDRKDVAQKFETFLYGFKDRILVQSAYSVNHYITFLKEYIGGE